MAPSPSAVIHISTSGKNFSRINYRRRMYAIIRRYTPEVTEGGVNECFANLTGLRTFFKMSYRELAENILRDLSKEIGITFTVRISTFESYESIKNKSKKEKSYSTYQELNKLFAGKSFMQPLERKLLAVRRRKLTIHFLGKVA